MSNTQYTLGQILPVERDGALVDLFEVNSLTSDGAPRTLKAHIGFACQGDGEHGLKNFDELFTLTRQAGFDPRSATVHEGAPIVQL